MRSKLTHVRANSIRPLLAATLGLALALTFSCSDSKDNDGGGNAQSSCPNVAAGVNTVACGGKIYRTVEIGGQVWMAENLNYAVDGSKCYDDLESNCVKYGRLYDWATAMGLEASCNSSSCASQITPKHKGICPSNYHIPTNAEWDALLKYVDSQKGGEGEDGSCGTGTCYYSETAGKYLKATSGWNWNDYDDVSGDGLDSYGFSALPGGGGSSGGRFGTAGIYGSWWSATEYDGDDAYIRRMYYSVEYAIWNFYSKSTLFSVRCLQD